MKDKKKLLILGPAHPFRGGIADTQNYLAQNLRSLGHEVVVFTFTTQYPNLLFPGKTQLSNESPPHGVNIKRKIHSFNPLNWRSVARSINHENPAIVIFRYWTPFFAPCWYSICLNLNKTIKKIGLVDNWIPHETRPWDKMLTRLFSSQMDGFATLSEAVGNQIKEDFPKRPIWKGFHPIADQLPPPLSKEKARTDLGWPKDKKIVLFFGLIRKYKGLNLLIEAFSTPPLKDSDVILAIVGEAYESEDKYVQLIKKLNLKERVICDFNYANTKKASRVFCAADVVAQTYISATQSGVTPLAYHYQTPLLVSDIPGLKKPILDDQTGKISEIDRKKIAEHLISMLDDKTLLGFESAYQKVNTQYSWKTYGQALINFMSQL